MQKIVSTVCPKCNNQKFHRYSKTLNGYQKYKYSYYHQLAPSSPRKVMSRFYPTNPTGEKLHFSGADTDETIVKFTGVRHYLWFVVDSETRFIVGFHLSPHRDSLQDLSLLNGESPMVGHPLSYLTATAPTRCPSHLSLMAVPDNVRVQSFKDDISNNLIKSVSTSSSKHGTSLNRDSLPSIMPTI